MEHKVRVAIVGGGPGGLTTGIYLARAGIECKVFDPGMPGGTVFMVHEIDNYPGFPNGIKGRELSALMEEQAKKFGVTIEQMDVIKVERVDRQFMVDLGNGDKVMAEVVVIATGSKAKRMGIKGEAALFGKGVSYCAVCDGFFYKNQDVAVIGGGDSAVQEAMYLSHICRKVYIIHRRDQLRAKKIHQTRALAKDNIEIVYNSVPLKILGTDQVTGIQIKNVATNEEKEISLTGVFFYIGLEPLNEMVTGLVHLSEEGFILAGEDCQTNVPGLFAVGDIRKKCARQIATAVADGCNASVTIEEYLMSKE